MYSVHSTQMCINTLYMMLDLFHLHLLEGLGGDLFHQSCSVNIQYIENWKPLDIIAITSTTYSLT